MPRKKPVFKNPRYQSRPLVRRHRRYEGNHLTNWILRQIQRQFLFDDETLAQILEVTPITIRRYFMNPERAAYRRMPAKHLTVLRAELAIRYANVDFTELDNHIARAKEE